MLAYTELLLDLATALAVGLLIGTERGWSARDTEESQLAAGIRTFGLVGLLGGLAALFASHLGVTAWIAMLVLVGLHALAGYVGDQRRNGDLGMTSEIALLLTFLLGSLALVETRALAAGCAVVIALLLSLKQALHGALRRLSEVELSGALKLLFISLVLLPALPNQGYGPWQAFNPYATWWMTSEIALLLTFLLGSLALVETRALAAGCAVVIALLLSLKQALHGALRRLSEVELSGALKLLFISLVLLPALPNQGYGPWQAFNPYATWWMVVLIAGIGFAAYVAVRLIGTRHGLVISALLGGLVSSTAMTITLARLHNGPSLRALLACGLLATSALMFPRVLLEVGIINPQLLPDLLVPLAVAMLVYSAGALFYYRAAGRELVGTLEAPLKNPFELGPALRFGLLLVLVLFMVEAAQHWLGDVGIYLVSLLSGMTDVDAITLSLARSARAELDGEIATRGIYIAAFANSLVKAALIALIGGKELALRTLPVMLAGMLLGLLALLL